MVDLQIHKDTFWVFFHLEFKRIAIISKKKIPHVSQSQLFIDSGDKKQRRAKLPVG